MSDSGVPKRIIKETERLQQEPVAGINCEPFKDNARHFSVVSRPPSLSHLLNGAPAATVPFLPLFFILASRIVPLVPIIPD